MGVICKIFVKNKMESHIKHSNLNHTKMRRERVSLHLIFDTVIGHIIFFKRINAFYSNVKKYPVLLVAK